MSFACYRCVFGRELDAAQLDGLLQLARLKPVKEKKLRRILSSRFD